MERRSSPGHVAIGVLCGATGGPASYGQRLVDAIAALGTWRVTVLTDRPERFSTARCGVVELPMRGGVDRLRWQHVALPRALRRLEADVYHDTKNALPRGLRLPAVVTVHDLAYYRTPDTFGVASRWFLRAATRDAVRRAAAIVVPSHATAADVREIFPRAADRVRVVPHGIDAHTRPDDAELAEVCERLALPDRFVLHVGTIQARKNVDLLVAAVRTLRAEHYPQRCVLAGRRGWRASKAFAEIERDDTALWLGEVDARDLAALYALADAFVSPSAYEGFGMTVGDALAAGAPTVISDVSSLPEVCGDAARRIDVLSADGIARALRPVLESAGLRAELSRAGIRRAAGFSWRSAAEQTVRVYEEVAGRAR